jgi:hypothetical protein
MGFDTIIGNGAVVTATDTYVADVAIMNGKIVAIGKDLPRENAKKVWMPGKICFTRRHRCAHASRYALRRHHQRRRLRNRNAGGGFRRNHYSDRLRDSIQRPGLAPGLRCLDEQSFQQGGLRLRLSLHCDRHWRRPIAGDERSGRRRRDQLQTFHGLSRRVHAR